jgi:hypothetical protein
VHLGVKTVTTINTITSCHKWNSCLDKNDQSSTLQAVYVRQRSFHTEFAIFSPDLEKGGQFSVKICNYQTCFKMSKLAILSVKNNFALAMKHSVPVKA